MGDSTTLAHRLWTVLVGIAFVIIVALLPDLAPVGEGGQAVRAYHAVIESVSAPTGDEDAPVYEARVRLLEGPDAGAVLDALVLGPGGSAIAATYLPGDEVVVTIAEMPEGQERLVSVSDRWRLPTLSGVVLLFVAAVVVVGGWHGLRALVALALTIAVILKILLPLVIAGVPPIPLAVVAASGISVISIVMTEGLRRASLAAIIGTTSALAITGLLAAGATWLLGFTYLAGSDLAFLATSDGQGLDLRGILLAAIILGAVGVLDDVTVTQAVLVDQLAEGGQVDGRELGMRAMRVGRSHIAATVNTLFLAYVGTALPLLVVLIVSAQPTTLVLNDETIATEVVRALIGSLGILAAIPLTTFVAVAMLPGASARGRHREPGPRPRGLILAAVGTLALLVLTVVLPLSGPQRAPMPQDRFEPGMLPTAGPGPEATDPTTGLEPSEDPGADGDIHIAEAGEPVPIEFDGVRAGTVTVVAWSLSDPTGTTEDVTLSLDVRYEAAGPWSPGEGSWGLLFADGTEIPLGPAAGETEPGALAPGASADVVLEGRYAATVEAPFVIYTDTATGSIVFAVPLE